MIATGPANLIKAQILANLNALILLGVLAAVIEQDINTNILDAELPGYPCAILGVSAMDATWEYQQANKRTYTYDILVIQRKENLVNPSDMEDIRDAIALQFDNNFTLAGAAPLGVSAVMSPRMPIAGKEGKSYVVFNATIKATTLAALQYPF